VRNYSLGTKQYEQSSHLGNVHVVVSDKKLALDSNNDGIIDGYISNLVAANDYFAYGSLRTGRSFNSSSYLYSFNGKLKDDEMKGEGNSYDFGARIYDSRLGRFLSTDPWERAYPWQSTYSYFANSPIWKIDFKGKGDPTKNPEISSANISKNSNRFKKVERTRTDGTKYFHTGVDIKTKNGDNIYAIKGGEVVDIVNTYKPNQYAKNSLGNTITIKTTLENGDVIFIKYCHLNSVSDYHKGQKVGENHKIGEAGATGNAGQKADGSWGIAEKDRHVHIEASTDGVFYGGKNRVDVEKYMDTKFDDKGNKIEGTGTKLPFVDVIPVETK
jgi:RHS repeat-associated protein